MNVFAGSWCGLVDRGTLHVCMCALLEKCACVASPCQICVYHQNGGEGEYIPAGKYTSARETSKEHSKKYEKDENAKLICGFPCIHRRLNPL